jgi:hypothetical protein
VVASLLALLSALSLFVIEYLKVEESINVEM